MANLAVGIDLGTTFSCVAVYRDRKVEIIPNNLGNKVMPSYVAFNNMEVLVGESAKNLIRIEPANTVFGKTKRFFHLKTSFYSISFHFRCKALDWPKFL